MSGERSKAYPLGPPLGRDRVLDDIAARRRPSADALKDRGLAHRFAGAKDRAAIAESRL